MLRTTVEAVTLNSICVENVSRTAVSGKSVFFHHFAILENYVDLGELRIFLIIVIKKIVCVESFVILYVTLSAYYGFVRVYFVKVSTLFEPSLQLNKSGKCRLCI